MRSASVWLGQVVRTMAGWQVGMAVRRRWVSGSLAGYSRLADILVSIGESVADIVD